MIPYCIAVYCIFQQYSSQYYGSPTESPTFTDIISKDTWQEDKYFAQLRLAGNCPFLIRKVMQGKGKVIHS